MISLPIFVSLALLPFVSAQSASTGIQIEAIEAHFTASGIVPSLLSTFDPSAVISFSFNDVQISPGQALTDAQVAPTPVLSITPANSSVALTGNFTVAMVDAGPVGTDESQGTTRHWLVNGVTIVDSKVANDSATAITVYAGPAPAAGTGPHRYVILLYSQPSAFSPPAAYSKPNMGVSVFDVNSYAKDSNLGPIVAATYFTVEEGTSTASLSATSAVVTSTLAPVSSTASSSGSSPSGSAGSTKSNGASGLNIPVALVLAAVTAMIVV